MEEQRIAKTHKLVVNNRKTAAVTGVLDVLSFDLNEILLETEQGMLMVKGTDLHVNRLSVEKGEVDLSGSIDSIAYSEISQPVGKTAEGFLSKLFKYAGGYDTRHRDGSGCFPLCRPVGHDGGICLRDPLLPQKADPTQPERYRG